jgi:signal transduction histidine kinase
MEQLVTDGRTGAVGSEIFARAAAHELMAPLVAAQACARMLEERLDEVGQADGYVELSELMRVLSRMRVLVETLLEDARSSSAPVEREPVSVQALVDDAVEMLRDEIRAHDAQVVASGLPVIEADGVLLGAVINNLLLNALRYGPRVGGEVRIRARREGTHWRISVTSQGPTIPAEDRARIFEPYFRGSHERRAAGSGLGLAICRSFVERHGGEIGVAPVRTGGNRFHFTVPANTQPRRFEPRPGS